MIKLVNVISVSTTAGLSRVLFLNKDHIVSVRPADNDSPGNSEIQVSTGVIYFCIDDPHDIINGMERKSTRAVRGVQG